MKRIMLGLIFLSIAFNFSDKLYIPCSSIILFERGGEQYNIKVDGNLNYELKYLNYLVRGDGQKEFLIDQKRRTVIERKTGKDVFKQLGLDLLFNGKFKEEEKIEESDYIIYRGNYKTKFKRYELVVNKSSGLPALIKLFNDDSPDSLALYIKKYKRIFGKYIPEQYELVDNSERIEYKILNIKKTKIAPLNFNFSKEYKIIRR